MKHTFKSATAVICSLLTAAGAHAAVQATQHEHSPPSAQVPSADAMKGMEGMEDLNAMMSDPAMRQKMMEHMVMCRAMISTMKKHLKHERINSDEPTPHP